jgi:hypothetical protein
MPNDRFSDRIGVTKPRQIQLVGMDADLRTALWNWLCWALDYENRARTMNSPFLYWERMAKAGVWDEVLHKAVDEIPTNGSRVLSVVKTWFADAPWHEVYNLIEYVLPLINKHIRGEHDRRRNPDPETYLNYFLEREMSGFRAIKKRIAPITAPAEIAAIEEAATPKSGLEGVAEHIRTALELLGKKPDPDYRNSIKESISAVESASKLLSGKSSGGIDDALKALDKQAPLPPAFKGALKQLYGYTSGKDGIRHAIVEERTVSFAEAKFMLVACSAFANFLIDSARG